MTGRWRDVDVADLVVGDVVEDAYANPAVVVVIHPDTPGRPRHRVQVTIMQLTGSDRGRFGGLPMFVRVAASQAWADEVRAAARRVWREERARKVRS